MDSGKYDRQLILEFLDGPPADDRVIEKGGVALRHKARLRGIPSPVVKIGRVLTPLTVTPDTEYALALQLRDLSDQSRLYLDGHGDWPRQTLGGRPAGEIVTLLKACGFAKPVKIISILGCQSARGPLSSDVTDEAFKSFAAEFHMLLGTTEPKIRCDVYARFFNVGVLNAGNLYSCEMSRIGQKTTAKNPDRELDLTEHTFGVDGLSVHHQALSKRRYYWAGSDQKWEWVSYGQTYAPVVMQPSETDTTELDKLWDDLDKL